MRFPKHLKKGDTIGFVAPSFGCTTEPYESCFNAAIQRFHALGYATEEGPNCRVSAGIGKSNTPELCGQELNDMYCADTNQVLISCGGGELMCEDLPFFDFARMKEARPKWYMGYSDNTNFTYTLTTICDVASIYGPCAASFGMRHWHASLKDAFSLLTGENLKDGAVTLQSYKSWQLTEKEGEEDPFAGYHLHKRTRVIGRRSDGSEGDLTVSGRLIGGCLDCLVNLLGTEFDHTKEFAARYREDGILWYLESCDLNVMAMRRAVWEMVHAGWFAGASGFLIGRPLHFGEEMMGLDQYEAVWEPLKRFGVPVVFDMDLGHLPPAMPIINGSMGEARVEGNKLTLTQRLI